MDIDFPRSFFGYDREEVEYRISLKNKEYEETMRDLTNDLFEINQEIDGIKEKINSLENVIAEENRLNEEVVGLLFSVHMETTKDVFEAMKEGEKLGRRTREEVCEREKASLRMKKTIESLTQDMESIAQCYNKALEAYKYG